jgi:hypothetical protein
MSEHLPGRCVEPNLLCLDPLPSEMVLRNMEFRFLVWVIDVSFQHDVMEVALFSWFLHMN